MTRSEALRINLERTAYLHSLMHHVEELAEEYHPILTPALAELNYENYRTVVRLLPTLIGSYIQEAQQNERDGWKEELTGKDLDPTDLYKKVEAMAPLERIYLLDCIVARRDWSNEPIIEGAGAARTSAAP